MRGWFRGSIFITCDTFTGTNGVVRANGGQAPPPVAGGRHRGDLADRPGRRRQSLRRVSAADGCGRWLGEGGIGTLYFPDGRFLGDGLHVGQWQVPDFATWSRTT
jgi:hypothetical protein